MTCHLAAGFWRLVGLKTRRDRRLAVSLVVTAAFLAWGVVVRVV